MDGQNDHLGMSDSEFLNAPMPVDVPVESAVTIPAVEAAPIEKTPAVDETAPAVEASEEASATDGGESKGSAKASEGGEAPAKELTEPAKVETSAVDFEAEYKRLLAPFRANGREVKVESVDDARANLAASGAQLAEMEQQRVGQRPGPVGRAPPGVRLPSARSSGSVTRSS